jgi:hypothetical protein
LVHGRDWLFLEGSFCGFRSILFRNFIRKQLGHLIQGNLSPRYLLRALYHGLRHFVELTVQAVKNHLDFDTHTYPPVRCAIAAQIYLL